jgi:hypothetical protein
MEFLYKAQYCVRVFGIVSLDDIMRLIECGVVHENHYFYTENRLSRAFRALPFASIGKPFRLKNKMYGRDCS